MKLVILHGWGHDKSFWTSIINIFETTIPTVAIDLPGFGTEPLISKDWGIPEYAAWTKSKLNQTTQSEEIILLGHSFGGRIASYIAADNPAFLKGLILCGAPCIYRPTFEVILKKNIFSLAKKLGIRGDMKLINPELETADTKGLGQIFRNIVGFDETEELKRIKIPTLLIWGKNDTTVPLRIAYEINQLIGHSQLEIMDASHNMYLDNPLLFTGLVTKFLKTIK